MLTTVFRLIVVVPCQDQVQRFLKTGNSARNGYRKKKKWHDLALTLPIPMCMYLVWLASWSCLFSQVTDGSSWSQHGSSVCWLCTDPLLIQPGICRPSPFNDCTKLDRTTPERFWEDIRRGNSSVNTQKQEQQKKKHQSAHNIYTCTPSKEAW